MRSTPTAYLVLALFAALGAAAVFVLIGNGDPPDPSTADTAPEVSAGGALSISSDGEPAPDFELATVDGEIFRLADHAGEVVVLNFWATWCAPCRVEIPDLVSMQADLEDEGVQFVGISLDHEGPDVVAAYADEVGINYPIAIDDGAVSRSYDGIYALPTTIVIDRDGLIRLRKAGLVTEASLRPVLEELAGA